MPICLIAGSGDVNGDGKVDKEDLSIIVNVIMGRIPEGFDVTKADINGDEVVNATDIVELIKEKVPNSFVLCAKDGTKDAYALADNPKVSLTESELIITSKGNERIYPMMNISRITYETIDGAEIGNLNIDISTSSDGVHGTGNVFYVYRNDGYLHAFLRDEVQSIDYSNYGSDNICYDEIVTQVINTVDSIYMIPLTAIDSVGFVTPETKYKQDVIKLEGDILNYVISQNSLSIFFETETPTNILPHVGDKLITMEMTDLFPIGFAGEVKEVRHFDDKIEIVCTTVSLLDIYDQYYGYSELEWDGHNNIRGKTRASDHGGHTFQPGVLTLPLIDNLFARSYQHNDDLAFTLDEMSADISVTPVITGRGFWIVDARHGVYLQLSIDGKYDLEENFGMKGSVNWRQNKSIVRVPWPILPLADVYLELGGFVEANGGFGIQQKWTQQYKSRFLWEFSSKGENVLKPVNRMIPVSSNHSGEATINGSIGAGIYLQIGVDFIHTKNLDIANVNVEGKAGVCLEGNLVLNKTDMETAKKSTAIYESLRDTYLSLNWYLGASANASILKYGISRNIDLGGLPFQTHGEIARFALAPTFTDVKASFDREESSTIDAQAKISCPALLGGSCLPVDAGFVLKDENGDDVSKRSYGIYDYKGGLQSKDIYSQFYGVSSEKKLRVYPHIKWMGVDILASPYADVIFEETFEETSCPDNNHPHWIDLGLPSGTKWRCCNEGASTPEGYGGYYEFGQVASAPTLDQIIELQDNTTYVWTTQNGVNGGKFAGRNGGTIFLPAAGGRWDGAFDYSVGSEGNYWSSTPSDEDALGLAFVVLSYAYWGSYGSHRSFGLSVRPVR